MKKRLLAILFVLAMLLALPLTANAAAGGLSSLTLTYATTLKFDSSGYVCPGDSPRGFTNGPAYGVSGEGNYTDKECTKSFSGVLAPGDVYYNYTKIKLNSSYFNSNPVVSAPSKAGVQWIGGKRLSNTEYEIIYKFTVGSELGDIRLSLSNKENLNSNGEVKVGTAIPQVLNSYPYYFVSTAPTWKFGYPASENNNLKAVAGGVYTATYTLKPYDSAKFGSSTKFTLPYDEGKVTSQKIAADGKSATVTVEMTGARTWLDSIRSGATFMNATKTITKAYIIGGYAAINKAADTNVNKYATVQRVYGDNRYLTCDKINKTFASTLTGKAVCIATGKNFPDALAGGVLAAKTKSPMLLVGDSLLDYQSTYIASKKPATVYVFGGTGAVSDAIANDAVKAAK